MRNLILALCMLALFPHAAGARSLSGAAVRLIGDGEPGWVYKGHGDLYAREGEPAKAIVAYKKALMKQSPYPEVNLQLAKIYLREGLYDLAISQIRTAEDNREHLEIPDLIYEVKYVKAEILEKQGKNPEAVYREIIEDDENWKDYRNEPYQNTILGKPIRSKEERAKFAKAHFELGRGKYLNRNYENAVRFLEMAVLYGYRQETAMRYIVDSYSRLGNKTGMERAVNAYRRMR